VLSSLDEDELHLAAKDLQAPYELVSWVAETASAVVKSPPAAFATPADAAMMMQLGRRCVRGSGIIQERRAASRADAHVRATTNYRRTASIWPRYPWVSRGHAWPGNPRAWRRRTSFSFVAGEGGTAIVAHVLSEGNPNDAATGLLSPEPLKLRSPGPCFAWRAGVGRATFASTGLVA